MNWKITEKILPGVHPVLPFSVYETLVSPNQVTCMTCTQQQFGGLRSLLTQSPSFMAALPLGGLWERALDPERALTHTTAFDLPPANAPWSPANVPQNYGLEKDLERYFGPLWYRRKLHLPPGMAWADLYFGAVDYLADVCIRKPGSSNWHYLGRHEGYFAPFHFSLPQDFLTEPALELLVRVQDPLEDLKGQDVFYFRHRKRWIKGTMNYHDSRPGGLPGLEKSDWSFAVGQSRPTGGIIGPVKLRTSGPVRLDGLFVTPLDCQGNLHLALAMLNRTALPQQVSVLLELSCELRPALPTVASAAQADLLPVDATRLDLTVAPGANRIDLEATIPDPRLWVDAALFELGGPNLYHLTALLMVDGKISSYTQATFGIRTAEVRQQPVWSYWLNGHQVYLRAANYIPVQHWANLAPDFYERDFRLLQAANLHAVGLHAHVQSPACYAAADRLGVSIFQDFPLQWAYASGEKENPGFIDKATAMAAEMAYMLWNHPSVVYYATHNEPFHVVAEQQRELIESLPEGAAPNADVNDPQIAPLLKNPQLLLEKDMDWGNYYLDVALTDTLKEIDPTRFVHPASGVGWDIHEYSGTIGCGTVYEVGRKRAPFVSEYGSWPLDRSAATLQPSWSSPWPPTGKHLVDFWREGLIGSETGEMAGHIDRYPNLAAFAYATERKAAFIAKYQTEFFRIERGKPYCGYRWHFFVNYWCRGGAGLLDVDRVPTLAYAAMAAASRARLVATILPDTIFPPGSLVFPIYGINDSLRAWNTQVTWRLERLLACEVIRAEPRKNAAESLNQISGSYALPLPGVHSQVAQGSFQALIPSNSTLCIGQVQVNLTHPAPYRLVMIWEGTASLEENDYTVLIRPPGWQAEYGLQVVE